MILNRTHILLFTLLLSNARCCQEIHVRARDGGVIVGRSMEFSLNLHSHFVTYPAGYVHDEHKAAPHCDGPATFTSKWKTVIFLGQFNGEWCESTGGGINNAGLSVGVLYFKDAAEYRDPASITQEECGNAIPQTVVGGYILARYDSVSQLKADLESGSFPVVYAGTDLGIVAPLHYNIVDNTGAALVLEHVEGVGVVWHDNTVGVLTNSPPYSWHMENLKNYPHFQNRDRDGFKYTSAQGEEHLLAPGWTGSGLLGLPGDYTSPSRFVKAATLLSLAPKPEDKQQAIVQVFHHMAAADIPHGIVHAAYSGRTSINWWTIIKDLTSRCIYYRAYLDLSVKRICLDDVEGGKRMAVEVEGRFEEGWRSVEGEMRRFEDVVPVGARRAKGEL